VSIVDTNTDTDSASAFAFDAGHRNGDIGDDDFGEGVRSGTGL
jgi:hypothetical protein